MEDDSINRLLLSEFLSRAGYASEPTPDGASALDRSRTTGYDLILLDMGLPDMDGVEVSRAIRQRRDAATPSDVPIIAVTAHAYETDHRRFLQSGVSSVVVKPVVREDFIAAVDLALRAHQSGRSHR